MKKILFSALMLLSYFGVFAQNNYLLSGSIAGIEISERGTIMLNQNAVDTSTATASETLWFKSPSGFAGSGTVQAGDLNVSLRNITSSPIKVSLYDFTKTTLIRTVNVSPGYTEFWGYLQEKSLNAALDYYWKIESIPIQSPVIVANTKNIPADNFDYINVLLNDQNLTTTMTARLKPSQTITGITVNYVNPDGNVKVSTGSVVGTYSFIYQVMDGSTIVGEATVSVIVGTSSQYCVMNIADMSLKSGSSNVYVVSLYSAYSNINPFNWQIINMSTGAIVRTGLTSTPNTPNYEISFAGLPTASYRFVISSSVKTCSDIQDIAFVAASDACNISIPNIDRIGITNNYKVNVIYANTSSYKYDATITNLTNATGITANSFILNLDNRGAGTYTVRVDGEGGKLCNFSKTFDHAIIDPLAAQKLETYVKFITGKIDNWEIRGLSSETSGRDYTTQWRIPDNKTNIVWQSYVSDWQNLGSSTSALASIGLQKDTARNEPAIWLSVFENRVELRYRATKSGPVITVNSAIGITFPLWLRLEKTGVNIVAKYSTSQSMFPTWVQIGTIANATPALTWTKLSKTLSVGSGKIDVTSTAHFQGHLGGLVNFGTASTITPIAPLITKSIVSPAQNDALTLTSSICATGSITKWYKNNIFVSAGNTLSIVAVNNDTYFAKCVNGSLVSDASNSISFTYGTTICDNNLLPFAINTISNISGNSYAAQFTAANLTSVNVDIRNSNSVSVRNYDTSVATNPLVIDAGTLTTGTYTLKLTGKSCLGNASKTFTVNTVTPTISCNNNGTFSISSITQSDGQLYNVTYNASNLTNIEAVISNSSNVAVRTVTLSVNSNPTIIDIGTQSAGAYTLQLNGLSCIGSTAAKTFNIVNNNPSCANGGSFSLASATYSAGTVTFQFNAANLSNATWTVRQGVTIISSGILSGITSSTNTVTTSTLASGTYTLQVEGNSCNGIAVRQFTVGTVTTAPTLACNIATPITGDNITLTATGCTGNYNFFKKLETAPFANNSTGTIQISNVQAPDYYYVQCASGSLNSNYITVASIASSGTGAAGRLITPTLAAMPTVTEWNRFYTNTLSNITIPQRYNAVFGKTMDVVGMIWHYPYRNLFAYDANITETNASVKAGRELTEMQRVGIKIMDAHYLVPCVERDQDVTPCMTGKTYPLDAYTSIVTGKGNTDDSGLQDWTVWTNWWRDPIWANLINASQTNGKYNIFMMCTDYEASHTRSDRQIDVNYQVVAAYAMDEVINGWVGQMYLSPKNSYAYVNAGLFTSATNTPAWFNAADNTVPTRFQGKKISGNPKFYGMTEQALYQESCKPEGFQMKDQNGNNWLTLTHFGNAEGTGINKNSTPNIEHWQTQIIGLGQANAIECRKTGQPFIYQLKLDNQRNDGYFYTPESAAWNDNKWSQEWNQYGILNCEFPDGTNGGPLDGQPDCVLTTPGSERSPGYIQEGQTIFSMFVGSQYIQVWGSTYWPDAIPKTKTANAQRGDQQHDHSYGNNNLEGVGYTVRGWNRMGQKHTISGTTTSYSVFDLMAEADTKYLNDATEYSVNGGTTWYTGNALIYQKYRIPGTLAMVNDRLGIIALTTQEAYNECSTQGITTVKVRYNSNTYDIEILANNVPNIVMYKIGSTGTSSITVIAPSITKNITTPTANQSVIFTSSGCQSADYVTKWYTSAEGNYLASGLTYTVNATNGLGYYAKCVGTSLSSSASNTITFSINNDINVFVFIGESNAGTRQDASTLLAGELGLRTGVRIWNNNTNVLEQLNVGTNNYFGENASITGGWGWEVELANLRQSGAISKDFVILKTAQGGALIGQYNTDIAGGYYSTMATRYTAVKNALIAEGKNPIFHVLYSQGINNALYPAIDDQSHFSGQSGITYWQSATTAMLSNVRSLMGASTKISIMKLFGSYGTYLNTAIDNIVNLNPLNYSILTNDLGIQADGLHIGSTGTRIVPDRYIFTLGIN